MAYTPPGVTVTEYTNPVVSPLLSTSDSLCLVGPTPGGIVKQDSITFSASSELLTGGWPTTAPTGWTATSGVSSSYSHAITGTTAITNTFAPISGEIYQVSYATSGASTANAGLTVTFGGKTITLGSSSYTASSTAGLSITPNAAISKSLVTGAATTSVTGTSSNDTFSKASHGLTNGTPVFLSAKTGGSGLSTTAVYYVINTASGTFQLSATGSGSTPVTLGSDVSAVTVNTFGAFGDGTNVTYTTTTAHGFVTGQLVNTAGITTTTGYNVGGTTGIAIIDTPTTTTFRIANTTTGAATTSSATATGNTFDGTVAISIKQANDSIALPSIPAGGKLLSVSGVVLAESAPSGNAAGIHYEPFTEPNIDLNVSSTVVGSDGLYSATFTVPIATGKYWAVGQTVAAVSGSQIFASDSKVTSVVSSTDGVNKTITVKAATQVITTQVLNTTIYVNQTTSGIPTHYSINNATAPDISLAVSDISASGSVTTINVNSLTGWPSTFPYHVKIDDEIFHVTAASNNQLTVTGRADLGTSNAAHSIGATVKLYTNTITRNTVITNNYTGSIALGDTVTVTYTYIPSNYFNIVQLDTMSDVEDRFGPVYKTNGQINCPLSLAAAIAFENGVNSIYLQPLFTFDTDLKSRLQPTNVDDSQAWTDTFVGLQSVSNINFIVPVVGAGMQLPSVANQGAVATTSNVKSIHAKLKDHIAYMVNNEDQYIIGIVGHDGANDSTLSSAVMTSYANDLRTNHQGQDLDQQMVFVSATKLQRPVSVARTSVALNIGGQYAAAAIGSMAASRNVSMSLTRKNVAGFSGLLDVRTKKEKNSEAAAGLLVFEQVGNAIQVRHSLTTDNTGGVSRSEFSVVRAKNFMMSSLKNTVDTQIIGNIVADGNAPLVISTAIASTLERLKYDNDIVDYSDVQARTTSINPTTVDVRFNYRPAFPVNYINIGFSIDLTAGNASLAQSNTLQVG